MLVTLGTNQNIGASSSHTYTYSPQSVQKVFLKFDDDATIAIGTTRVTVQIGSRTICNGVSLTGLIGLTSLQTGFNQSATDKRLVLNFGSHQLQGNDNLYVTVSTVLALNQVDCSAIVDTPGEYNPMKITEYSDTTFTSEFVYTSLNYTNAGASVDEDNYVCEIRTATESSAPNFISSNNNYSMSTIANYDMSAYGLLTNKNIPETTTFNYSSSAATDSILVVQAMPKGMNGKRKAIQSQRIALSTLPNSLR
ncbi:MAG: hypothetical protein [Circular genetic element sp.]|nr:MAG: hypothetical protein [Circular genetic element sp.]